jgi:hypothetical protein
MRARQRTGLKLAAMCVLGIGLAACTDTTEALTQTRERAPSVAPIGIDQEFLVVRQGEKHPLHLASAGVGPVSWRVADGGIASVDSAGVVTARGIGSTMVSVAVGGWTSDVVVTVLPMGNLGAQSAALR